MKKRSNLGSRIKFLSILFIIVFTGFCVFTIQNKTRKEIRDVHLSITKEIMENYQHLAALKRQISNLEEHFTNYESELKKLKISEQVLRMKQHIEHLKTKEKILSDFLLKERKCEAYDETNSLELPEDDNFESKQQIMIAYKKKFPYIQHFVETGTRYGTTVAEMIKHFDHVHSIELHKGFQANNRKKFKKEIEQKKVNLIDGDSTVELPKLLDQLDGPALFWLDGHFSGGKTARGMMDTPIIQEILSIIKWKYHDDSVILIDDARLFVGYERAKEKNYYPSIQDLKDIFCLYKPDWMFEVKNDIIRVHKM